MTQNTARIRWAYAAIVCFMLPTASQATSQDDSRVFKTVDLVFEAWMLDGGARLTSAVVQNDIVISVPQIADPGNATVVVLELDKKPIVYKAPTINFESD
ncbi:MAG: hypothetical protein IIB53_10300, partial [Planctomycetes bacterium]|nr:hypothetical protein [Planctomycetota bacterium]